MPPGRLHALIDGVFAIAVTLLVLDLPRPAHSEHLARDLLDSWPSYAAYVVSFVTIGLVWIEHHGLMSAVRFVDRRFIERTLVLLFAVSIIPWPTALAAEYAREGGTGVRTAALLYTAALMLMGLAITLCWRYLLTHPDLVAEPARPFVAAAVRRSLLGALAYAPAVALAPIIPIASFAIATAIAIYFALTRSAVPGQMHRAALTGGP